MADEVAISELFAEACVYTLPSFEEAASIAAERGMLPQTDGTFKGNGFTLNPAVKLTSGPSACIVFGKGGDHGEVANALLKTMADRGLTAESAVKKGTYVTVKLMVDGRETEIKILPFVNILTSLTIFQP